MTLEAEWYMTHTWSQKQSHGRIQNSWFYLYAPFNILPLRSSDMIQVGILNFEYSIVLMPIGPFQYSYNVNTHLRVIHSSWEYLAAGKLY